MRPVDDAGLQFILAIQDGLRGGNRIPAADQDIPLEVHFSGWKEIRTARSVVMKLSEKYPYRELYEKGYS